MRVAFMLTESHYAEIFFYILINKMFAVIEFLGSDDETANEMAIVPVSWISKTGRKCQWPNKLPPKISLESFVRNNSLPKSNWPSYRIYKIHKKIDSYDSAEEEISDLLRDNRFENEQSNVSIKSLTRKKCISPSRRTSSEIITYNLEETCEVQEEESGINESVSPVIVPPVSSSLDTQKSASSLPSTITASSRSSPCGTISSSLSSKFNDEMINKITKIETHVEQHTAILNELSRFIQGSTKNPIKKPETAPEFPIRDIDEFKKFDLMLKSDELLSQYLISRMAGVGGIEVDSTTRAIMRFLINDEVAKSYNWKGRDKLAFEKTNIMPLIYESVKRTYPNRDGVEFIINKTVKDWLKYATSRLASKDKLKK